jgi:inner membrane protein
MEGKTHAGIGAVTYIVICDKLPGKFNVLGLLIVIFASLLPDIDHPKSIVNKYILPFKNGATKKILYTCLGIIVLWFDYLYVNEAGMKALGGGFIAIGLSSHRNGLTHSLTGLIIFAFIAGYIGEKYNMLYLIQWFLIGYGMHLIGDMCTKRGIPLFYPFIKKKVKFPMTYSVGSKSGKFFEGILMIFGLVYTVYRLMKLYF